MKYLDEYSTEDLHKELEKRKKVQEELEKPKMLESFDLGLLMKICSDYMDFMATDYNDNNTWEYRIFNAAIDTFYNKDVWAWILKKMAG